MVYACNKKCSIFCLVISIWGIIQLILMGIFYNLNAVSFLDLVPLKTKYNSLDEFRNEADDLYKDLAVRCYVSAIVYGLFVVISLLCLQIKNNQIANAVKKKMYAKEQV